jgi:hypothetical protein
VHPLIGKRAAIKIMSRQLCFDQHAVERFLAEARSVNQIAHPNIVDIFAFGTLSDGRCYFVMEWLSGETLAARLKRDPMPLGQGLEVLLQICDALQAAHKSGIVHRDLKPDNVFLVDAHGRTHLKLLDFGIAKLADSDVTVPRTRSGVAIGTAGYMSPEQARGKHVDHRTDIYALGAMAYEMVLGRRPFDGESAVDILAQHLADPPPPPSWLWPGIPESFERLLLALLEKRAEDRPELHEVRAQLAALQGRPLPERRLRRRRFRARRLFGALALSAAFGGALGLFWHSAQRPTIDPAPPVAAKPQAAEPALPPPPVIATPRLGALVISVNVAHSTVRIDSDAPRELDATPIELAPGSHRVVVGAASHKPVERVVQISAGRTLQLVVELPSLGRHRPPLPPPTKGTPIPTGDYTLDPFK